MIEHKYVMQAHYADVHARNEQRRLSAIRVLYISFIVYTNNTIAKKESALSTQM